MLLEQATQLVQSIPSTVQTIVDQLNSTFDLQLNAAQVTATLHLDPSQIQGLADDLAGGVIGALGTLVAVTFDVVTVVVFTFYIAAAGPRLVQQVAVWLPPDRHEALRAGIGAVHDRVAAIQPERVLESVEALARRFVAGIDEPAIGLQQGSGTEIAVAVPPIARAGRGAAGAQDALVQTVELLAVLRRTAAIRSRAAASRSAARAGSRRAARRRS